MRRAWTCALLALIGCVAPEAPSPTRPPLWLAAGVELHARPADDPGWLELPDVAQARDRLGPHEGWLFLGEGPRPAPALDPGLVYRLSFAAGQVDVAALVEDLAAHPGVEALFVWDAAALEAGDYAALTRCRGLRSLTLLGATTLDGAALASLARAPGLERLRVAGAPVDGAGLANLALAPRLRLLTLEACPNLADAAWLDAPWAGLEELRLHWNPRLPASGLAGLAASPAGAQLRALGLRGAAGADWAWLGRLDALPELTALDLSACRLDEQALRDLGRLTALTDLRLEGLPQGPQPVGDGRWLAHLAGLRELTRLDLGQHALGPEDQPEALVALSRLPRLEALDLSGWELGREEHATLQAFPALRWLCCNLWGESPEVEQPLLELPQVTGFRPYVGIEPFTERVANLSAWVALERLDLRASDETGDGSLRALQAVPQLVWLLLDAAQVTDAGLQALLGCRRLEVLSLRRCDRLSAEAAEVLVHLGRLRVLDLRDCPWVDDTVLARLGRLDGLECVLLRGTHVSASGVAALRRARPGCLVASDL